MQYLLYKFKCELKVSTALVTFCQLTFLPMTGLELELVKVSDRMNFKCSFN